MKERENIIRIFFSRILSACFRNRNVLILKRNKNSKVGGKRLSIERFLSIWMMIGEFDWCFEDGWLWWTIPLCWWCFIMIWTILLELNLKKVFERLIYWIYRWWSFVVNVLSISTGWTNVKRPMLMGFHLLAQLSISSRLIVQSLCSRVWLAPWN